MSEKPTHEELEHRLQELEDAEPEHKRAEKDLEDTNKRISFEVHNPVQKEIS